MRFGTYSLPISHDPAEDGEVIDRTLREIILAEELGFDAAWLTEQIAELRDAGVRNMLLQVDTGGLAFEEASRTMHLFQEKVAPLFRS